MSMVYTIAIVSSFWCVLFTIDKIVRRYRPWKSTYSQQLEEWGLTLSFAHIRCYTTKFNRMFHNVGNCNKSMCRVWFGMGAFIGVLLMLTSMAVLCFALYQTFHASEPSEQVLTPVLPGVNLPWKDILYYLLTLAVCGVFHEVGHAVAASVEQVRVNGFGLFVLFFYPGAFVDLHSDHLSVISPRRQLRIYCAGVWHNVILALFAFVILWCLPVLLAPFYTTGIGAVITAIPQESVFVETLNQGGVISAVNSCPVYTTSDWYNCIEEIATKSQPGYCVYVDVLDREKSFADNQTHLTDDGTRECCNDNSQSDICFQVVYGKGKPSTFKCLTARTVSAREVCLNSRDCKGVVDYACVFPAVSSQSRLIRISHTDGKDALFLGDPRALHYSISTSSYLPNGSYCPLWLPELLQVLCMYVISFSSALALLNMVPAYFLDGQWALTSLIELFLEDSLPNPKHRRRLCNCILFCGSLLLGLNICLAIWTLIHW